MVYRNCTQFGAILTAWFNVFQAVQMLSNALPVALADASTSRQYREDFTGYQYGNALNLRWPFWCTRQNKALNGLPQQYLVDYCELIATDGR